jgi:hypothetical protein
MQANSLIYSSSGQYAVEIKREDTKSKTVATVYYKKEKVGLQQLSAQVSDTWESVLDFLQKK